MLVFRSDPYLWLHLAGVAIVPLWLSLCLLGLAIGEGTWPTWAEFLVIISGSAPVVWMQWRSPFYLFNCLGAVLSPQKLSFTQRQVLSLLRFPAIKWATALTEIGLLTLLWWLYTLAPLVSIEAVAHLPRIIGVATATVAFAGASLFVQIPASVLALFGMPKSIVVKTKPYPIDAIHHSFTMLGLQTAQPWGQQLLQGLSNSSTELALTASNAPMRTLSSAPTQRRGTELEPALSFPLPPEYEICEEAEGAIPFDPSQWRQSSLDLGDRADESSQAEATSYPLSDQTTAEKKSPDASVNSVDVVIDIKKA